MSDTPKEMALEMKWADAHRVQLVLVNGDKTLFSDYCDPRSGISRNKVIDRLLAKFPTVDREQTESALLELARGGPPREEAKSLSAVEPDPEPWSGEVNGARLLDGIVALLRRYIILPPHSAEVCALWIVHTYVFACFEYTARLLVNSPDKRCGKSRLMRLLHALCRRPLSCECISAAALFRSIEAYEPTLFLDEADTYLSGHHVNEDLRGVLNAGHQRGGKVVKCVGDNSEPTAFNCFAPVAIAMIGRPPGTVEDRSIPIAIRRKAPGERVEKYAPGQSLRSMFIEVAQQCVRWANDHRNELAQAQPEVPSGLDDRAADCWFGLFAVADVAGERWPALAREVAVAVMGGRDGADSIGVQLLKDLQQLFSAADADRLSSAGIVAELAKLEDRPWPEYRNERPITANQLAKLLKPFGVSPKTIRLQGDWTPKGYAKADFEEAWARYLSSDAEAPPAEAATPPHTCDDKDLRQSEAATADQSVADENSHNPLSNKGCGGVAPPAGGPVQNRRVDEGSVELAGLVSSMAEELDAPGVIAPFRGEELRHFYDRLVREDGVVAALTDARARHQRQLLGEVMPLRRVGQ
ncbi:MAG TPA: DUF3631 domain-containing protein [Planctomycetota bacterium]|nr:DUF3631 domain-containing protein [Planctomycetota bacterium]